MDDSLTCKYCGKLAADDDLATDGIACLDAAIYSPAVGDWFCVKRNEDKRKEEIQSSDRMLSDHRIELNPANKDRNLSDYKIYIYPSK
jgi:hypothetical protein